jgi:hypothetical protein
MHAVFLSLFVSLDRHSGFYELVSFTVFLGLGVLLFTIQNLIRLSYAINSAQIVYSSLPSSILFCYLQ